MTTKTLHYQNNSKYSDWQRIDLHLHTDFSKKTKNGDYVGNFSVDVLKKKLLENQVGIFSLTDHNIINIEAYREYYKTYNPETDPLLLLGVELDIKTNSNKRYHSILVFNCSNIESVEIINRKLENKYSNKKCLLNDRVLSINDIVEVFPDDDFLLIPHAGNSNSIVGAYSSSKNIKDAQKMLILMPSALEKVIEKARQIYNDGFDELKPESFQKKDDVAYIECSDNHNINEYPCTHKGKTGNHSFYHVKGKRCYETLRLAFFDPESRIKSQEELNKIKDRVDIIEQIVINEDTSNPLLLATEISFSPYLNVLIGSRSSGKSLLMSIFANKIDGIRTIQELAKYEIDYKKIKIKTEKDDSLALETTIPAENLIYLNQGEITNFFESKSLEQLAIQSGKRSEYAAAKNDFVEHKKLILSRIDELVVTYDKIQAQWINQSYILHDTTIVSCLGNFLTYGLETTRLTSNLDLQDTGLDEAGEFLEELKTKVGDFEKNTIFDFEGKERILVKEFSKLIANKEKLIKEKQVLIGLKLSFIYLIDDLITEKNSGLTRDAEKKSVSIKTRSKLVNDIALRFKLLGQLKTICTKLEDFKYNFSCEAKINDDVQLILEVEKKESLKDAIIIEGIKGGDNKESLFLNLLSILDESKSFKNSTGKNDSTVLRKKINVVLKGD